jgi:large subunit ribosomal protein LP2
MKYIAAYVLAVIGGDAHPNRGKIAAIISAGGIEPDNAIIDDLLAKVAGKNLADIVAAGSEKLSLVGAGGVGGARAPVAEPEAPAADVKPPVEEKKEEEEMDAPAGFDDLFGDD